jgi:hypothetical protein
MYQVASVILDRRLGRVRLRGKPSFSFWMEIGRFFARYDIS